VRYSKPPALTSGPSTLWAGISFDMTSAPELGGDKADPSRAPRIGSGWFSSDYPAGVSSGFEARTLGSAGG
jgi:hypothetical protein